MSDFPFVLEQVHKYGWDALEHVHMDALRREHCMCRHCDLFAPGTEAHCPIAAANYAICVRHGIAMSVTRCPEFIPRTANRA